MTLPDQTTRQETAGNSEAGLRSRALGWRATLGGAQLETFQGLGVSLRSRNPAVNCRTKTISKHLVEEASIGIQVCKVETLKEHYIKLVFGSCMKHPSPDDFTTCSSLTRLQTELTSKRQLMSLTPCPLTSPSLSSEEAKMSDACLLTTMEPKINILSI
ncbi:uncharacterized protein LOC144376167 [Ictidomys tridecemlineatus]